MGLFDDLLKSGLTAMGGSSAQQQGMGLATGILQLLTSPETGGMQGLVQTFTQKGFGDIVSSWVGTGSNLPISGEQVQSALGSNYINSMAHKAGMAPEATSAILAEVLPLIVDKMTPNGSLPEAGGLFEQALNLLKGRMPQP